MNTPQQKSYKILLIGDSCIDQYHYGECKRLNPESASPLLAYNNTETNEGMCLNVFNNIKSFKNNIHVELKTNKDKSIKHRYVDLRNNAQLLRVDYDVVSNPLNINEITIENYDTVAISDYDKGYISHDLLFSITQNNTVPIFIYSKKNLLPNKNCYLKINEKEYDNLVDKNEHSNIIITLGSKGAKYLDKLYTTKFINNPNVIGAGDTFFAALVVRYTETKNIEDSIAFANKASSISVKNKGTYVLNNEDINLLYRY